MSDLSDKIRKYLKLSVELEEVIRNNEATMDVARANFRLALLSGDPKRTEENRLALVGTFSAGLDRYIAIWRELEQFDKSHVSRGF